MLSRISTQAGPLSFKPKSRVPYRYYRWSVTKQKDNTSDAGTYPAGIIQASEIQIFFASTSYNISSATATNPGGSNPTGEEPDKINDGNTNTKWLDRSGNGVVGATDTGSTKSWKLVLDLGSGNAKIADAFRYATANDVPGRDPIRWTFEGSNDSTNWTTLHTQSTDATITDTRFTYTQIFYFQV